MSRLFCFVYLTKNQNYALIICTWLIFFFHVDNIFFFTWLIFARHLLPYYSPEVLIDMLDRGVLNRVHLYCYLAHQVILG